MCAFKATAGGQGGGMFSKTARAVEALGSQYRINVVSEVSALSNPVVLVEPLLFSMRRNDEETVNAEIAALKAYDAFKILYCSEKALLRLNHKMRRHLIGACDVVTYNCAFQCEYGGARGSLWDFYRVP